MKRFISLAPLLVLFLFAVSPAFSENSSDQAMIYRLKEGGIKEIHDHFSTDEKIYAEFTFLPGGQETGVEFRWINPLNKRKQTDFELVKSPEPPKKRTVVFWMSLQSRWFHKIVGSSLFGRWRLEIWVDGRRITEKAFDVGIGR
jgi:hypothetical protein